MIKAFIFDLDDTFYDCFHLNEEAVHALCRYAAKRLQLEESRVQAAFDQARITIKEQIPEDVAARHNRMLYMEKLLELLEIPSVSYALELYEYFWNYVLTHMHLFDGVEEFLQELKRDGIQIGICTDMTVHIQHRKLRTLGIASYIDQITTSEEAGREKPDPRIYHMALRKLQVRPEEAVYVGDSWIKDVVGPEKLGMTAVWYTDGIQKQREDNGYHAADYEQLRQIYRNLKQTGTI